MSISGVVGSSGTVRNCVALNSIVTTSYATSIGDIGRVVGSSGGTMSNNYARGDMTVRYNWNGSTGTDKTVNAGLATQDGATIGSWDFNDLNWWQNTANWTTGGAWDFTNTWEMNANNLPKLKNVGGNQDHFVLVGNGSETNPFIVYDVNTLRKVGSGLIQVGSGTEDWGLSKHYRQTQNIALPLPASGQSNWTAIGTSSGQFTGRFDGNGFTISNLTVNRTSATYQGLFGYIGTNGVVKNIGLVNGNVSGGNYSGGVAGYNHGTVQNCYVTGSVNGGTYTGGVAGYNNGTVQNCYAANNVSGSSYVGGVAGQNNNIVQNCYAVGSINGSSGYIGGVVGSGGTVRNCVALNPSLITSGNSSGTIGRVSGTGSGSNNHARSDMVVKYNWNGLTGARKTISAGLTTVDGASITATQWKDSSWWQTTTNWNTASGASVWNFTGIWAMNVNDLPMLKTVGGVQNHALGVYVDFMETVWIPDGSFTMGSPTSESAVGRFDDEGPQRTVTLNSGFYMGKYPVTQEQYQTVMGTNPSGFKTVTGNENAAKLPVEMVTWYDAVEFCNKLSQLEGLTPVYTISGRTPSSGYPITSATVTATLSRNGYRLPTEAQWEYACRAGTKTAYYTGASINYNTGWYNENSGDRTHEVGKKPALGGVLGNKWGLYDMHGNVWEWCWDWFGDYSSGTQTDPTGPISGTTRVNRGGSWYSSPQGLRSACRNADLPSTQFANLGFRVVRP
jgi:formylglycine-generating enzyme required for sulfatase activity